MAKKTKNEARKRADAHAGIVGKRTRAPKSGKPKTAEPDESPAATNDNVVDETPEHVVSSGETNENAEPSAAPETSAKSAEGTIMLKLLKIRKNGSASYGIAGVAGVVRVPKSMLTGEPPAEWEAPAFLKTPDPEKAAKLAARAERRAKLATTREERVKKAQDRATKAAERAQKAQERAAKLAAKLAPPATSDAPAAQ